MSMAELMMQVNGGVITLDELIERESRRSKVFVSNGTFTVPEGVTEIWVSGCAAGGTSNSNNKVGTQNFCVLGGNAGEWIIKKPLAVTPGQSIPITVGTGNTIVGDDIALLASANAGVIAKGAAADGALILHLVGVNMGDGLDTYTTTDRYVVGGNGTPFGRGGDSFFTYNLPGTPKTKINAKGYGSGAGRDQSQMANSYHLGAPGPGIVIIEW